MPLGRVVFEPEDGVDRHLRGIGSLLRFFDAPLLDVLCLRETPDRAVQAPLIVEVVAQIEARTHLRVIAVDLIVLGIDAQAELGFEIATTCAGSRRTATAVATFGLHRDICTSSVSPRPNAAATSGENSEWRV